MPSFRGEESCWGWVGGGWGSGPSSASEPLCRLWTGVWGLSRLLLGWVRRGLIPGSPWCPSFLFLFQSSLTRQPFTLRGLCYESLSFSGTAWCSHSSWMHFSGGLENGEEMTSPWKRGWIPPLPSAGWQDDVSRGSGRSPYGLRVL